MADLPRNAWTLSPSFKPVEVVLSEAYPSWRDQRPDGYYTDKRKWVRIDHQFPTKAEAIEYGRQQIIKQEATIAKQQASVTKRRAALDKAEAQS